MNLQTIKKMADAKGYTEKWIDLLSKILGICVTFLGAQIAFWAVSFLSKDGLSDLALTTATIGLMLNILTISALIFFLVKKIKIFGSLQK